jgi:hypothetical protein
MAEKKADSWALLMAAKLAAPSASRISVFSSDLKKVHLDRDSFE